MQIRDVALRNHDRRAELDLRTPLVRRFEIAALHRRNGLLQHRLIQLKPNFADMARLFLAKQIAGAANIEIVRGE